MIHELKKKYLQLYIQKRKENKKEKKTLLKICLQVLDIHYNKEYKNIDYLQECYSELLTMRLRIRWLYPPPLRRGKKPLLPNSIWWWNSSSSDLEIVEYPFIVITLRSTLTRSW